MLKSITVGNCIRDFFSFGFNSSFEYNMTQFVQRFVDESKELYEKILNDTRDNPFNETNYDKLLEISSKSFSLLQKNYGLKYDSFAVQPLDCTINSVNIGIDPIIPGRDPIIHKYSLDGNIKCQKTIGSIAYMLLKTFKAVENLEDGDIIDNIKRSARLGIGEASIIPISYCIPLIDNEDKDTISEIYKPGKLAVYTRIDKDDLYRLLTIELFDYIKYNISFSLDVSSYKELCRSIFAALYDALNKIDIVSNIFRDFNTIRAAKRNIARSTFGSVSKYYESMSTSGVRGFILKKFKYLIKSTNSCRLNGECNINQDGFKNYADVAFGSMGKDHIFNSVISEILKKRMFDKYPSNNAEFLFEFITSNVFLYIISSGSICVGETGSIKCLNTLIDEIPEEIAQSDSSVDVVAEHCYNHNDKIMRDLVSIIYGIYNIKYIYDAKKRNRPTTHLSPKEYKFSKNIVEYGFDLAIAGLYRTSELIQKYADVVKKRAYDIEPPIVGYADDNNDKIDIEDIFSDSKQIFMNDDNIISRLITLPSLNRIGKNVRIFIDKMYEIRDKGRDGDNPVSGDKYMSEESVNKKWLFGNLFSESTENMIGSFVSDCRIGGNVELFCNNLKKDALIAAESGDDELISDCIKKTFVLNELKTKNPSEQDLAISNSTLESVFSILNA